MKIIIIGAGLAGITSAFFLARDGHEVTVIDRSDGVAMGASHANGGLLTYGHSEPWNSPGILMSVLKWIGREDSPMLLRPKAIPSLIGWGINFIRQSSPKCYRANTLKNFRLASYSMSVLDELRRDEELHYEAANSGTLKIYRSAESLERVRPHVDYLRANGVPIETVSQEQVVGIEPALQAVADRLCGGILSRTDETGDARIFCEQVEIRCRRLGVQFEFGQAVSSIEVRGGKALAVMSSSGRLAADQILLAAGSWTPLLAKSVGLDIPIRPVKGYSATIPMGSWAGKPCVPVIDDDLHAAVTPFEGRLRIAGTAEFTGYNDVLNARRIQNLLHLLHEVYPNFQSFYGSNEVVPWTGLRPVTSDGVPLIGETRIKNLFLNSGHGPLGWTLAAGSGRLIADVMSGVRTAIPLGPYAPDRS